MGKRNEMSINIFKNKVVVQNQLIANTLVIYPMECNDANSDGTPSPLTRKRYLQFAASGAGAIWFETISISEQGRTNKNQLVLNNNNIDQFQNLLDEIYNEKNVFCIAQISHGGKHCFSNEIYNIYNDYKILDIQREKYMNSVSLAPKAGFKGIDFKMCHGFLMGDILFNFEEYTYLGNYKCRVQYVVGMLREIAEKIRNDLILAVRIDITEFLLEKMLSFNELVYLVGNLKQAGVGIYSFSNKEYYIKKNKNLKTLQIRYIEIFDCIKKLKHVFPNIITVSPGLTMYGGNALSVGKELIDNKIYDLIGFGRQALAYPDFAKDILQNNILNGEKCCTMCGGCSELRRRGERVKCIKDIKFPSI